MEQPVLDRLSQLAQPQRLKIVLAAIEKKPNNADAWINACIRNQENADKANRLLGVASVQRRDSSRAMSADRGAGANFPIQDASPMISPVPATGDSVGTMARGALPADEAITMKENWPRQKSDMIRSILAVLDEDVMSKFLALDPEDQAGICFAFMVTAAKEDTPTTKSVMINSFIDRLHILEGSGGRPAPPIMSQPSCCSKVSVQFILAGMPAIMAGTIISICQQAIPKLHQEFAVHILPTIFVQVVPEEISIESVGAAYRVSFRETVRTMEDLSNELASLLEEWKKTDTKFIFVTNVGIPPTPDEATHELEASRLHRGDTEFIWPCLQAAQVVRQHTQDSDVAEIFFGPPAPSFISQICPLWGQMTHPTTAKHPKIPVMMPQVFSTPSGFTVLSVVDNPAYTRDPIEKWDAPGMATWMEKYDGVPIPPSMASKLQIIKQFKERPLKTLEEDMLKAIAVKGDNGSRTSLPRARFMSLYGYQDTPAEHLLDQVFACSGEVIATTGDPAPKATSYTAKCGYPRYCRKCEKLFAMIDRSYPTNVVCDVLLALFTKVAPSWSGKTSVESSMWARSSDVGRTHTCGPECRGHL